MFEEGGRRLLEERKRLKMNQDAMAEAAQVAKSTYCNYEAGKRAPDEAALLDNYRHTPPDRRHTVQEVSSAFAQYDAAVKRVRAGGGVE